MLLLVIIKEIRSQFTDLTNKYSLFQNKILSDSFLLNSMSKFSIESQKLNSFEIGLYDVFTKYDEIMSKKQIQIKNTLSHYKHSGGELTDELLNHLEFYKR